MKNTGNLKKSKKIIPPKLGLKPTKTIEVAKEDSDEDVHKSFIAKYLIREGDFEKGKIPNSFFHTGSIGDVWASLPCVMECCRKIGKKAIYYLRPNVVASYYEGAVHPTINEEGDQVGLNDEMIKMMIPLLKAQPYIEDAKPHTNEKVRVVLNAIRYTFVNMPNHPLSYWYFYVYPDTFCDVSKPYIFVPETKKNFAKGKIIISRTERYLNQNIKYKFLKKYENHLVFAGTSLEHTIFNARFGLNIPRLIIKDFLELAQAIKQSEGLLSNQTQAFQIAEGTKSKRAVELCKFAPNVIVQGEDGFEFYSQEAVEYWVGEILK